MPALTITISPDHAEFAKRRATELGLKSPDELVCRLLDSAGRRRDEHQRIESLLVEGVNAEPGDLVIDAWWDELDTEVFGRPRDAGFHASSKGEP